MQWSRACRGLMPQQVREVFVGETPQLRSSRQCAIDRTEAVNLGQRHRRDHLGAHPRGAYGRGRYQPVLRANADGQEGGFVRTAWPRCAMQWAFRLRTEVQRIVARLTWHGWLPPRDLLRAVITDVNDDDLVVLLAHPDLLADVLIWDGVFATFELHDGELLANAARDAERGSVGFNGQRVESLAFVHQPLDGWATCDGVRTRVDSLAKRLGANAQLGEAGVVW